MLFFIIGMIKPGWALFFINKPGRFPILAVTTVLIMICVTLYGEGLRREKLEKAVKTPVPPSTVPVPVPAPESPAIK